MKCSLVNPRDVNWEFLDSFADRTVFQTRQWLDFIAQTQRATPLIAELQQDGRVVGFFSGLTFSRFGVKILGSSFPGWTTPYIGFNLLPGISRAEALMAVEKMAWDTLKCLHIEVSDPYFTVEDGQQLGFGCEFYTSHRTDLTQSEEQLFKNMDSACRRCIRKAEKSGVRIEEAHDPSFADEYYDQLKDVFAKQGLVPNYKVERVRALIEHLAGSGRVLLLRARDPKGNCIATGIFPGFNKIAEFWGNASYRSSQILRPNEAIQWYVMRYWKRRGIEVYDWGGDRVYKEKYGCTLYRVPWFTKSRYQFVSNLRQEAKNMVLRKQRVLGWLRSEWGRRPDASSREENAEG